MIENIDAIPALVSTPVTAASTLYDAGCESLVSDASSENTYKKMIQVAFIHAIYETFHKEVFDTEKQIKKDFEITSMPGPWRSSKSVIQGAMKLGIPLIDDNGGFVGKTTLQNLIKAAKAGEVVEETATSYTDKCLGILRRVPKEIKQEVYDLVSLFIKTSRK